MNAIDSALPVRLSTFLAVYARLRPKAAALGRSPFQIDVDKLEAFLKAARPYLEVFRDAGGIFDPWQVAGIGSYEIRNAAVLAAFLSPRTSGRRGPALLSALCQQLGDTTLPSNDDLASDYIVRTEHCPVSDASDRVDLTIDGKTFVLGIEIKIYAQEGPQQLERYRKAVATWAGLSRRAVVLYLTPDGREAEGVVSAKWGDVAAAAQTIMPKRQSDFTYADRLLAAFARRIREF